MTVPVIYEAHIGMATAEEKIGSYREFTENVLPGDYQMEDITLSS